MPELSIITVNLNNRDGLVRTAESVCAQTYGDYEWMIIDGGSADGSVDVIKKYAAANRKLTYWRSGKDGGIYQAMNRGIDRAAGEYCYFLNSGDYLFGSSALEELFKIGFNEDIVYGDMMFEDDGGNCRVRKFRDKLHPSDLLYGYLPHQNMFIKTKLLKVYGGYRTDYRIIADWAFYTEAICRGGASYRHIPVAFAINEAGGVSNDPKHWSVHKSERIRMTKELFPFWRRVLYFFSAASVKSKIEKIGLRYERAIKH